MEHGLILNAAFGLSCPTTYICMVSSELETMWEIDSDDDSDDDDNDNDDEYITYT